MVISCDEIYLCPNGNVAQANAGHGDVLSGVLGALLAQGLEPVNALKLGAVSMGLCVDRLSEGKYLAGVLAHEAAQELLSLWNSD